MKKFMTCWWYRFWHPTTVSYYNYRKLLDYCTTPEYRWAGFTCPCCARRHVWLVKR